MSTALSINLATKGRREIVKYSKKTAGLRKTDLEGVFARKEN